MKVCEKVVSVTKDEMIEQLLQQVASLTTIVDNQTYDARKCEIDLEKNEITLELEFSNQSDSFQTGILVFILPESEKEYDRNTAFETLKLVLKLGYKIEKQVR